VSRGMREAAAAIGRRILRRIERRIHQHNISIIDLGGHL